MAEDNNRDAKQISKREAKRAAKIEAKRRKLAEKRTGRTESEAPAPEGIIPPISEAAVTDAVDPEEAKVPVEEVGSEDVLTEEEVIDSKDAVPEEEQPARRQVTADSANVERRVTKESSEEIERKKAAGESIEANAPAVREAGIVPVDGKSALAERRSNMGKDRKLLKKGAGFVGSKAKSLGARAWHGLRNASPAFLMKCAVALIVLIGIIFGALEVADYYDKKSDVIMTDAGFEHAAKYSDCVPLIGIDISEHQEGEIDWEKVKSSGVDYVFIRAGYRAADNGKLYADKRFESNMEAAEKSGLMVGVYFYSQALTPEEGKEEAEYVLEKVKEYDIKMPLVIDYEIYKDGRLDKKIQAGDLYAASFYHDIVLGFTETVEAAGYESAVYANKDMLTNYMQWDLIDDMATIWLARYEKDADFEEDYWLWQCSDEGVTGGITANVDQNFWYLEPEKVYPTRAKHKKSTISVGDCRISFRNDTVKLHNFRAEPKFAMTYEGTGMKEGRDYVSSVVHNTQEGTGYVIIRGIGKYKDWIMYPFTID